MFEVILSQRPGLIGTRPLGELIHQRMAEMTSQLANDIAINLDIDRAQHDQISKAVIDFGQMLEESFTHVVEAASVVRGQAVEMADVIDMKERISG